MFIKALCTIVTSWSQSRGVTMEKQFNYGTTTTSIIMTVFKMLA